MLAAEAGQAMDTQALIELVRPKLALIAPRGTRLSVIEDGVRRDGDWWVVPVRPEGERVPPPDFLYPRYATVEADLADEHDLDVLIVPVARESRS